jgi:hypothetical protein
MGNNYVNIIFVIIILAFGCHNNQEVVEISNLLEYKQDGELKSHGFDAKIYEDKSIEIDGHFIVLHIENSEVGEYALNENSYTTASSYPINVEKEYSANTEPTDKGRVIITKLDEEEMIVSGIFYFDGNYTSGNEIVKITEGVFENIQLEVVDGNYKAGKISAKIDNNEFKYTDVNVTDSIDFIRITVWHPNNSFASIQIPSTTMIGSYPIVESDIKNKSEVVFNFDYEFYNGLLIEYPISNCFLITEEIDFDDKIYKGRIEGTFSNMHPDNNFYEEIIVDYFEIDLNWN